MTDHASNGTTETFTQAAKAADDLLGKLQDYQAALGEITGLRADAAALRDELAAALEPTRRLAASAEAAARTYDAVEAARPQVEVSLAALQASASQAAGTISESTARAAQAAANHIENSARSGADRVGASAGALDAALGRAQEAADALDAKVSADGAVSADALIRALADAAVRVRQDTEQTLTLLVGPSEQAGSAVVAARDRANEVQVALRETVATTGAGLKQAVRDATTTLSQRLVEADEKFREDRTREIRQLVRVAWATLAAVVLLGALLLWRSPDPDPGLDLGQSTLQVLNGVDPKADYAAEVGSLLTSGPGGTVQAVIRGDAATSRQQRTLVLVHGASMEAGRRLARELGTNEDRVVRAAPLPLAGQATLLLGADFREAIPATGR